MPIDYDDMMQSGATGLAASYDEKDVMLYALGVGFGRDPLDEKELPFVYENNGLKVVPTFASVIARGEAPPERHQSATSTDAETSTVARLLVSLRLALTPWNVGALTG